MLYPPSTTENEMCTRQPVYALFQIYAIYLQISLLGGLKVKSILKWRPKSLLANTPKPMSIILFHSKIRLMFRETFQVNLQS